MEARTVREALLQQALVDIDRLLERLEVIDVGLADKIEHALKGAAGKSLLDIELRIENVVHEQSSKLRQAGQEVSQQIDHACHNQNAKAISEALTGRVRTLLFLFASIGVASGATGGVIAYALLHFF